MKEETIKGIAVKILIVLLMRFAIKTTVFVKLTAEMDIASAGRMKAATAVLTIALVLIPKFV